MRDEINVGEILTCRGSGHKNELERPYRTASGRAALTSVSAIWLRTVVREPRGPNRPGPLDWARTP